MAGLALVDSATPYTIPLAVYQNNSGRLIAISHVPRILSYHFARFDGDLIISQVLRQTGRIQLVVLQLDITRKHSIGEKRIP